MTDEMTTEMPDIWAGVPEVTALQTALGKAQKAHTRTSGAAYNPLQHAANLAEHLAAGGDIPADYGRQLWDAVHATESAGLQREVVWQALEMLRGNLAEVKRRHAGDALKVLDVELVRVITEVRQLEPKLGNVTSAESAIGGGKAQEWGRLTACARRHAEIRVRQHDVVVGAGVDRAAAGPLIARAGRISNALNVDPLRTRIATGKAVAEPWPAYSGDSIPYLRWLASPKVQPWVPSVKALQAAAAAQDRAVAEADYDRALAAGTAGPAAINRDRLTHKRLTTQLDARR